LVSESTIKVKRKSSSYVGGGGEGGAAWNDGGRESKKIMGSPTLVLSSLGKREEKREGGSDPFRNSFNHGGLGKVGRKKSAAKVRSEKRNTTARRGHEICSKKINSHLDT